MLFRMVRPMRRRGTRNHQYTRRIPADLRAKLAGVILHVPVGGATHELTISPRMDSIRFSLRTDNPTEVKARNAAADEYLENVFAAHRRDAALALTPKQAHALAGELYRAWANGEGRERTTAVEYVPGVGWQSRNEAHLGPDEWQAVVEQWHAMLDHSNGLEAPLGVLADRLLLARGVRRVTPETRTLILTAFGQALADAAESRKRNAAGDYATDPKAERFPEWSPPQQTATRPRTAKVSMRDLVVGWWAEAEKAGRSQSTHESYEHAIELLIEFLKHDDASQVTPDDIVRFKDHRLATINPRNGRPISWKTVNDSDLSGIERIFKWAIANKKLPGPNPAEGIRAVKGKTRRTRSKGFTDEEATAILAAATNLKRGGERPWTFAAKRWAPWLMAYNGARVGEIAQLRKEDVRREGEHWVITITPEAYTVKTSEVRDVVVHPHLVSLGFIEFVQKAPGGYLFMRPTSDEDVRGKLRALKNRLAEFAREVVPDERVAPNHGWRHRFKSCGLDLGIEGRVLDIIQGHAPDTEGKKYGRDALLKAQARAMARIPRYKVR